MQSRTEGIVLRASRFGEADTIVTYLTLDFGIKKAFAKSSRKIKSRFGGSLEVFTHSAIGLMGKEDAQLPRLVQSDIIKPFYAARESYKGLVAASSMAELLIGLLPEAAPNPEAFRLLLDTLEAMDEPGAGLYALAFRIRLLALKGYGPWTRGCIRCGAEDRQYQFYVSQGAVVCPTCAMKVNAAGHDRQHGRVIALLQGSAKMFEALATWDMSKLGRLKASAAALAELTGLLDAHIEHIISRPLRAVASL